jgi:hypothetical protein
MRILQLLSCAGSAAIITACAGGAGSNTSPPVAAQSVQRVSGTLSIVTPRAALASSTRIASSSRKPLYVSAATKHAALFIDGAAVTAGSTTTCSAATGTGTGCTITWSAALTVPAIHTFAVETDSGTNAPTNTVLAEGSGPYAIVAGVNTLAALSLNGVVREATFTVTSCTNVANPGSCAGNVTLSDAANDAIAYTGATAVPTNGQSPTSGNVYDNNGAGSSNVSFTSSGAAGAVNGTAQSPFSSFASPTLTVVGVDTTGTYAYSVACAGAASTGTFGITVGGGATPSGDVTAAELSGLTPAVFYPTSGVATEPTAPLFACATGVISSATGTLPVN